MQRRFLELAFEQLCRTAQSTEWVLDLVRELANHRAAAAELREQRVLARDALVVRGVGELDQHAADAARRIKRRNGHVEHAQGSAGTGFERNLAA